MRSSTARRPEPASASSIERARPLLGTIVSIRVAEMDAAEANAIVDSAFAEIATIHRLMSFQDPASELGRINRNAADGWVRIDPRTETCIRRALDFAATSDGAFDPTAATTMRGNWRDIAIEAGRIRFHAPIRLDLSGIAKGHAVDRACEILGTSGAPVAVVDAGGDLRVFGGIDVPVALRPFDIAGPALVMLADGAIASSDPRSSRAQSGVAGHLDGRTGWAVPDRFVSVVAPTCIDADALTKIVLAIGHEAEALLATVGAIAHIHDRRGWSTIGTAA